MKLLLTAAVTAVACAGASAGCFPTVAARLTYPARVSVEAGLSTHDPGSIFRIADGLVVRLEPGLAGGKIHAGIRHQFTFLFIPLMTWDYTLSMLRTWGDPWGGYRPDQTWLGVEVQTKVNLFLMSGGAYWHVAGRGEDRATLFSGAVGIGF